jgi:hypothetical protein
MPYVAAVAFLLLFFGVGTWKASHPPQSPSQSRATEQQNSTENKAAKKSNPDRNETQSLWVPTDSIGLYTLVLSGFTAILAVATISLGILSFFQIRLARAEYISTHRPRIVLREVHLLSETIHYMLVNTGQTKATIVEGWIFAEFVEQGTRLRPLRSVGHRDLQGLGIAGGEAVDLFYPILSEVGFAIRHPEVIRIGIEDKPGRIGNGYFVGALVYEDDLRVKRRSIFRRRWDDAILAFVRLTPEEERDHEYAD